MTSQFKDLKLQTTTNPGVRIAREVNDWIENLIIVASSDSGVKDWIEVAAIGYRSNDRGVPVVGPVLSSPLNALQFLPIREFHLHPWRVDEEIHQFYDAEKNDMCEIPMLVPSWLAPLSEGRAAMCHGLRLARQMLTHWVENHQDSFPPIVVHLTKGEYCDGDPIPCVDLIRNLKTNNGHTLVFNCQFTRDHTDVECLISSTRGLRARPNAEVLFRMSSPLPESIFQRLVVESGMDLQPGTRGYAVNSSLIGILSTLTFATGIPYPTPTYSREICRANPACFLLLIDQSADENMQQAQKMNSSDETQQIASVSVDFGRRVAQIDRALPNADQNPYVNFERPGSSYIFANRSVSTHNISQPAPFLERKMDNSASNRVPYSQEISRATPACFLFLIDQSLSMEDRLGGTGAPKCEELATAINGWIDNMIIKASGDQGIRDWMEIAVIGYHTDDQGVPIIKSALDANLGSEGFIPISKFNENARVVEKMQQMYDAESGEMTEFPTAVRTWIDPFRQGGTPMCHALHHAHGMLENWIANHSNCYPPIVVHITDGESDDGGDPSPYAEAIRSLGTEDGNVLMFNCHLSMHAADKMMFPNSIEMLPDQYSRNLYKLSSIIPQPIFDRAVMEGFDLQPGAKGFVFNADAVALVNFLDMGTRVAKNLR